jgi:hypothetical protein
MNGKIASGSWSFHVADSPDNFCPDGGSIGDEIALCTNTRFTHKLFAANPRNYTWKNPIFIGKKN